MLGSGTFSMVEEWMVYLLIRKRNMGKLTGNNERAHSFEIIDITNLRARLVVHVWDEEIS